MPTNPLNFIGDDVRQEIIDTFTPHWALNDAAHRQEHFEAVFQTGMHINKELGLQYDPKHILFAAYFHDLFAWSRPIHHLLSGEFVMGGEHPLIHKHLTTSAEREWVGRACEQHRASFKGRFYSPFCELINSADRGTPGDLPGLIQRCYDHRLTTMPDASEDERMADAIKHLKHKSGSDGYARYPDMYKQVFGEQLERQRQAIDKL
ncbi:hypothetical protein D3C81_513180 [compost metagenome]